MMLLQQFLEALRDVSPLADCRASTKVVKPNVRKSSLGLC